MWELTQLMWELMWELTDVKSSYNNVRINSRIATDIGIFEVRIYEQFVYF